MALDKQVSSTALDKLMAMGGKELYDFLEKKVKSGKTSRAKATRVYKAWLELRGYTHISDLGWVTQREIEDMGLVKVGGEWCVPAYEIVEEKRTAQGSVREVRSAVNKKTLQYFEDKRRQAAAEQARWRALFSAAHELKVNSKDLDF